MKHRMEEPALGPTEEVLATFGEARLVRVGDRVHLRGGSMSDRMEALEWLSVFMPEAVACVGR
jgi:hypothetical protein